MAALGPRLQRRLRRALCLSRDADGVLYCKPEVTGSIAVRSINEILQTRPFLVLAVLQEFGTRF